MIVYTDKNHVPFQIDEQYYEAVSRYCWYLHTGYPATQTGRSKNRRSICVHQFLFGFAPKGLEWDHINRNRLDNHRANLRLVTRLANNRNKGIQRNNTTGHVGIYRFANNPSAYQAKIWSHGQQFHLGAFPTLELALLARECAKAELWKDESIEALLSPKGGGE